MHRYYILELCLITHLVIIYYIHVKSRLNFLQIITFHNCRTELLPGIIVNLNVVIVITSGLHNLLTILYEL